MRTSTAKDNHYRCPKCNDETTRDEAGRGFVRHLHNIDCDFEKGEKDVVWKTTQNRDSGSLRTGQDRLEVGDMIEIQGEGRQRTVTYVMGRPGNWFACFRGQGAVPEGQFLWRWLGPVGNVVEVDPPLLPQTSNFPSPKTKDGRLHTVKLVLEIVAIAVTVISGVIALGGRFIL